MPLRTAITKTGLTAMANAVGKFLQINSSGLAVFGYRTLEVPILVCGPQQSLAVGDGACYWEIGSNLNGAVLTGVRAYVVDESTSGNVTVQVRDLALNQDILSTAITVESGENSSATASTQPVVNSTYNTLYTGQVLTIDIDAIGTGTKGLQVTFLGHFGAS